jgi:hypothetical protein
VSKYIDANENGERDAGDGAPLAGDLGGWSFTVSGPAGTCTGTTDSAGNLGTCTTSKGETIDLTALFPGTYTVTENSNSTKTIGSNSSAFFNTDPGPTPATPPVSKTASVGIVGSSVVSFGNTCFASASFEVDGVPTDGSVSSVTVSYTVNGGTAHTVSLTQAGSTWTASVPGLRRGDSISWSFYIDGDSAHSQAASAFSLAGYPTCGGSQSVQFPTATVNGLKYKDINGNGSQDLGEPDLQGFKFNLINSSNKTIASTSSDATGAFHFTGVNPGTYTIHEEPVSGWKQTQPAGGGDASVTVFLGETSVPSSGPVMFGDTPLSKITISFASAAKLQDGSGTDATKATGMQCTDAAKASVGSDTNQNSLSTSDLQLNESQVTCTVTYADP